MTVADGSDGFRALEAPGGAILPVAQGLNNDMYGSTGFTSGLYWIKDIQNANQWQFVSTLTGADKCMLSPQNSFLVDYTAPTGTSVAYCWKTNAIATNNDGTLTSQVSANPTTGVSVVTYTANGQTETVGHGLDSAPDVIIFGRMSDPDGVSVNNLTTYTSQTNDTSSVPIGRMILNQTNAVQHTDTYMDSIPTADVFSLTAGQTFTNKNGCEFVAYCFAGVPGFSSVGSYTANGDPPTGHSSTQDLLRPS